MYSFHYILAILYIQAGLQGVKVGSHESTFKVVNASIGIAIAVCYGRDARFIANGFYAYFVKEKAIACRRKHEFDIARTFDGGFAFCPLAV